MDFSNYLFRCSALGHLMGEPKGKSNYEVYLSAKANFDKKTDELAALPKFDKKTGLLIMKSWQNKSDAVDKAKREMDYAFLHKDDIQLSDGAKTHLLHIWVSETKRRRNDIKSKYIKKGLAVEEDGLTIYSRLKKLFFKKNDKRLKNLFIQGEPDTFIGELIHAAERIIDIKCSWDASTFYITFIKELNPLYFWQGMGYMWLTGAKFFDLAYCLVNTPLPLIEAEKKSLWWELGKPEESDGNYLDGCAALEKNMLYDDIPLREKMLEYTIEYNQEDIDLLKKKIVAAREYLNWLDNEFTLKFAA